MKCGHYELIVRDPHKSLTFYRDYLGFELVSNQGDKYIWLQHSGSEILLKPGSPVVSPTYNSAANIVLYSDNLEEESKILQDKGLQLTCLNGCFLFTDPDGNWFQLVNPAGNHRE